MLIHSFYRCRFCVCVCFSLPFVDIILPLSAERYNFTTGIFPNETFLSDVHNVAKKLASFPIHSVIASKKLVRRQQAQAMIQANIDECRVLEELVLSPETMEAVVKRLMEMK